MSKIIKLREYIVTREQLNEHNIKVTPCYNKAKDSVTFDPYDGVILEDIGAYIIYNDNDLSKELKIITNDVELEWTTPEKEDEVILDIDDSFVDEQMPEFGLSTDTNINICQLNLPLNKIRGVCSEILWWDMNHVFHRAGNEPLSEAKLEKGILNIQRYGYSYPLVLYIDDMIRSVRAESTLYMCKVIGKDTVPCRIMCYNDIRYIKNINEYVYERIKNLPSNRFYHWKDDVDVLPHMIINYSDKRNIIARYAKPSDIVLEKDNIKKYPISKYKVIFPFIFDDTMKEENEEMLIRIRDKKYPPISFGKHGEVMSLPYGREMSAYLNGYAETTKIIHYGEDRNIDDMKGYIQKVSDFDFGKFDIDHFNYDRSTRILNNHIMKKLGLDFMVPLDDPSHLGGIALATNDTFNKEEFVIGFGAEIEE